MPAEAVNVTHDNTDAMPYSGLSAGSKTTYTVGAAVLAAARDARNQVFSIAAEMLEAAAEDIEISPEGAVRLGFRRELDAIADEAEREAAFEKMVGRAYQHGKALHVAEYFEIDDVIDPADTRRWIATLFDEATPRWWETPGKRRPNVDTW